MKKFDPKGYTDVPDSVIFDRRLKHTDLAVYIYLLGCDCSVEEGLRPHLREIARDIHLSDQTVRRALARLAALGYWVKEKHTTRTYSTDIEIMLADGMDQVGIEYVKQFRFGDFCPDFAILASRLFIQADGDYWHNSEKAQVSDARFERLARKCGWRVLRFPGSQIKADLVSVLAQIKVAMTDIP